MVARVVLAVLVLSQCWGGGSVAQDLPPVPAEVVDLCRMLKDQIINRGDPSVIGMAPGLDTDVFGMPRPSGGGTDIGAIECDSGTGPQPKPGAISVVLRVSPSAPAACQQVSWTLSGAVEQVVSVELYLRDSSGSYGTPTTERTSQETSLSCASLPRPASGSWLAVARAVDREGTRSAPSNEIELLFGTSIVTPKPDPQPKPGIPPVPEFPRPAPPKWPTLPPPPGGGQWLTDSCVWRGNCR